MEGAGEVLCRFGTSCVVALFREEDVSVRVDASGAAENVSVVDTWKRLSENTRAVLIDVRTRAEWSYVGVPDLTPLGKQTLLVEWQTFPDGRLNPAFVTDLSRLLDESGTGKDADLYFICRSGARSQMAAQAMMKAGYASCFNVAEGFEGPLDEAGHRGQRAGWQAQGLPWVQS